MRSFCICEKIETQTVMQLGGIDSKVVNNDQEARNLLQSLLADQRTGLIMISENIHSRLKNEIMPIKLKRTEKLIIQIPEPEGLQDKEYMMNYIKNSIGIRL